MPNAMLAATPPRRTCRSDVRNDREILSSCSTTRESAKSPSKVMRWSVAMEPVMAICTGRTYPPTASLRRADPDADPGTTGDGEGPDRAGRALRTCGAPQAAQLKESPQAQLLPALGLSMVKPCFSIVSAKSIV